MKAMGARPPMTTGFLRPSDRVMTAFGEVTAALSTGFNGGSRAYAATLSRTGGVADAFSQLIGRLRA